MTYIKSPLKWAGGKHRLLAKILPALPCGARLVEPFAGSGVVFLNSHFPAYLLCDLNPDLVSFFRHINDCPDEFTRLCATFFTVGGNSPESYYQLRTRFNTTADSTEKSALFLYLNRHSFNGLMRYNSRGEFNAPFGRYIKPYFPHRELCAVAEKLAASKVSFQVMDFRESFAKLQTGDVVYCDPPYLALSPAASFTSYTGCGFGLEAQKDLSRVAVAASNNGYPVVISNHDTKQARSLYAGAEIHGFSVQRLISCNGKKRQKVPELLAIYKGL